MKKTWKKLLALVLMAVMVMGMSAVAAFADEEVKTTVKPINVTINGNEHADFLAIQIFKGVQEVTPTGTDNEPLSSIAWGDDVTGKENDIITAINEALELTGTNVIAAGTPAKDVAKKLGEEVTGFDNAKAIALAKKLDTLLNVDGAAGTVLTEGNNVVDPGYYLVIDKSTLNVPTDDPTQKNDAYNASLLQFTKDIEIKTKSDAPNIVKKLKNEGEADEVYRDINNVAIGDIVDYRITSEVPDMTYYDQYYFIVTDTLSKGLTYQDDSLTVKVGSDELTATEDAEDTGKTYKLTTTENANGSTTFEIVFNNFKQYTKDAKVEITYKAELNEDCVVGTNGNPNEVDLTYSNNPNKKGDGVNKPTDEEKDKVTGKTPKDYTITYTTNLKIKKVDASSKAALAGVKFTIKGYKENDVITYTEVYEEDAEGTYYKLTDGSYTTKAPTELTAADYDSTETKYILTVKKGEDKTVTPISVEATTDASGMIDVGAVLKAANVGSVAAGKYVFTEAETLGGYNLLDEAITVVIEHTTGHVADATAVSTDGTEVSEWTYTKDGDEASWDEAAKACVIEVENSRGTVLPETGGIGTTIFYVLGAILVLGGTVVLVTRRRMAA